MTQTTITLPNTTTAKKPTIQPEQIRYDAIYLGLVPKIVDKHPEIFDCRPPLDDKPYWRRANVEVQGFFRTLPQEYVGTTSEKRIEEEKAALFTCENSPYNIRLGFHPGYTLLSIPPDDKRNIFTGEDCISVPLFDLYFTPKDKQSTRTILEAALERFYLYQEDIEDGTLRVCGLKDQERVTQDLNLLREYLPQGTTIKARCDFGAGNGQATYRL